MSTHGRTVRDWLSELAALVAVAVALMQLGLQAEQSRELADGANEYDVQWHLSTAGHVQRGKDRRGGRVGSEAGNTRWHAQEHLSICGAHNTGGVGRGCGQLTVGVQHGVDEQLHELTTAVVIWPGASAL